MHLASGAMALARRARGRHRAAVTIPTPKTPPAPISEDDPTWQPQPPVIAATPLEPARPPSGQEAPHPVAASGTAAPSGVGVAASGTAPSGTPPSAVLQ